MREMETLLGLDENQRSMYGHKDPIKILTDSAEKSSSKYPRSLSSLNEKVNTLSTGSRRLKREGVCARLSIIGFIVPLSRVPYRIPLAMMRISMPFCKTISKIRKKPLRSI
jgi:hypothetical protein